MKIKSIKEFHLNKTETVDFFKRMGYSVDEMHIKNVRYDTLTECMTIIFSLCSDSEIDKVNNLDGIDNELLDLPVTELDISIKTLKLLKNADLNIIRIILEKGESFLGKIYGFGTISMLDVKNALNSKGIELTK